VSENASELEIDQPTGTEPFSRRLKVFPIFLHFLDGDQARCHRQTSLSVIVSTDVCANEVHSR